MSAVKEEIKLAFEMFSDAQLMYREKRMKSAVNRLYYAMFHATKAILLLYGTDCQSHAGALSRFGEIIIRKGLLDEKFAKSLHRAYRLREKSDYSPTFKIEFKEVKKMMEEAEEFINTIIKFLKEYSKGGI